MTNFLQRLFSRTERQILFPKISFGFKGEDIEYVTENNSLCISSTFIGGRKIFTDSIQNWKNGELISEDDKTNIFRQVIQFVNKKSDKPIIVINVDHDKLFWESLCKECKDQIKTTEFDSDRQKEEFQFNYLLSGIQKGGILVSDGQTIKTETEFIEYWKNRNPK
jgi:hypothetical protein